MQRGLERATSWGRLATAIATAIAVIFAAAPIVEAAPPLASGGGGKQAISPSQLPFLESEPLRHSTELSPGQPYLGGPGREPVPVAEVESRRKADTRAFRNDDGSLLIEEYSTPIHYRGGHGKWLPIDNTLRPVPTRPGWVGTAANDWTVAFGPLSQGLEISTAQGTISMVPSGWQPKNAPGEVSPEYSSAAGRTGPRRAGVSGPLCRRLVCHWLARLSHCRQLAIGTRPGKKMANWCSALGHSRIG